MRITRDEIEFLISQYLDGTANELDRARIEEVLATDAGARAILSDYQRLNVIVKSALPVPEIAWDEFSASISAETAKLDIPLKSFRIGFGTWSKVATIAAMLAVVVGGIVKLRPSNSAVPNSETASRVAVNTTPIDVEISAPPALASAPVSEIQIGQPSGLALVDYHSSEAIVSAPSSIWIASGEGSAQDNEPPLY